ncbi:hypothetical protein B0J11DRAFT_519763 [Dendryphion nanum]|uniref:NAD(P)-binding protein n=1 Tax=Dendryphion nanum TaxID=256645 RepID=A0A9P9EF76_9PLEO|nr:hypothetical protein B0J11DRAFT_519763 [Dendryphion nanum]
MTTFTQICPPPPSFTEDNLIDLSSKVYLITGATAGIGHHLATLLYTLHATVYIGARSLSHYTTAITTIQAAAPTSKGILKPFIADLSSLQTIKPAVSTFQAAEYRLDVLFLNAGVMTPVPDSKTINGYDLEIGTNCLASFLLVSLLQPMMQNVASHFCHPNQSIRVVWVSSLLNVSTPHGGVQFDENGAPKQLKGMENYMQSKAGVYLLAQEFSRRQKNTKDSSSSTAINESSYGNPHGVLHISLNPGHVKTELQGNALSPMRLIMGVVSKGPRYGAYTELFAGLAPGVNDGNFVIPWGRKGNVPDHIAASTKARNGGKSVSAIFYEWCEQQIQPFV